MGCANWERIVTANGENERRRRLEEEREGEEGHCLFLIDTHYCCGGGGGNDVAERQIDAGAASTLDGRTENRMEQKSVGSAVDIPRGQLTKQNHARVSDDAVVAARQLDERRDRPIDPSWKGGRPHQQPSRIMGTEEPASERGLEEERKNHHNQREGIWRAHAYAHTRAAQLPNKKAYLIPFLKLTVR